MRKFYFLTAGVLLYTLAAVAQMPGNLRFGRIGVDKGLSQSTVYCAYQDNQGFMWFGTEDGLNKYDGYSFDVYKYDPTDSTALSNNIIRCIFEDSRKELWI